jgi:hypothetical protein
MRMSAARAAKPIRPFGGEQSVDAVFFPAEHAAEIRKSNQDFHRFALPLFRTESFSITSIPNVCSHFKGFSFFDCKIARKKKQIENYLSERDIEARERGRATGILNRGDIGEKDEHGVIGVIGVINLINLINVINVITS